MRPDFPESSQLDGAQQIGAGASAIVFSAKHKTWGKVAVKVAHATDDVTLKLFRSEYTLLRSFRHPAVLSAHDFFYLPDGRPAIVAQFCEGGRFDVFTAKLPPKERIRLFAPVLSAIEYLHLLGFVHRDLKEENILMLGSGEPMLSDFGLAAGGHGENKERGGTLEYMAPEVIDNQGATAGSDLYSIGVIFYRLGSGTPLFTESEPMAIIARKRNPDSIDFDSLSNSVSPRFSRLVRQCLDPNPSERPGSIKEIVDQMQLDNLLDVSNFPKYRFDDLFHHFLYSYNAGFVRQELQSLSRDSTINCHFQEPSAELENSLSDHLKLAAHSVRNHAGLIEISCLEGEPPIQIRLNNSPDGSDRAEIDYPELDSFALNAMLGKIFVKGIDGPTHELLYKLTSGNLALVKTIFEQLESGYNLDLRSRRLSLSALAIASFEPTQAYFNLTAEMCPAMKPDSCKVANFLALSTGQYSNKELVSVGKFGQRDLEDLASLGLLDIHDFSFRKGYFATYLNRTLKSEDNRDLHLEWLKIVRESDELDSITRDQLLVHHYLGAGENNFATEAALSLSDSLRAEQRVDEAANVVERALTFVDRDSDAVLFVVTLMKRADLANLQGDHSLALSSYARAVRNGLQIGRRDFVATAYKKLGDVYKAKRDYRRGTRALDNAVRFFSEIGSELELSYCYNNIGNIYWINGDLDHAAKNYAKALEIQRRLGEDRAIASSLSNLGSLRCTQQDFSSGIQLFKESVEIKKKLNDLPELARTYNNLSVAYFEQDELVTAQDYLRQAFEINKMIGADSELMYNYDNFYEIEFRRGNLGKAREWLIEGLRNCPPDNHSARGGFIAALANLFLQEGRYGKAGTLLAAAHERENRVTDRTLSMSVAAVYGEYYRLLHDFGAAHDHTEVATDHARKMGQSKNVALYLIRRARIELALEQPAVKVGSTLDEAATILKSLPVKREKLELLLELAELGIHNDNVDAASATLNQALEFPEFDGSTTFRARLNLLRGRLEMKRRNFSGARVLLSDAALAAKSLGIPEMIWQSQFHLAECLHHCNELERSLKAYIEAFNEIRRLAGEIPDLRLRKLYLSDKQKKLLAKRLEEMSSLVT